MSRYMRLRQYAANHRWPRRVRVLMAVPGNYIIPRRLWDWPRRHALMNALALLLGRPYRKGPR